MALILARGGSKRLPGKNLRNLCGKPLLAWSIEAAKQAVDIDTVVVSTDDSEICSVAERLGASVPFIRPPHLAADDASSIDSVLHALDELPEFDWVLLLQPTSPLRSAEDINAIIELCVRTRAESAVSVCKLESHPEWMYEIGPQGQLVKLPARMSKFTTDNAQQIHVLNGALYLARVDWLRQTKAFIGSETQAFVMPQERSADIDTQMDWDWVEFLMSKKT